MNACFVVKKQQLLVLVFFTTDQVALAIRHLADDTNDSYAQAQIMHYTTEDINALAFQIPQNMSPLNFKAGESTWSWSQDKRGERTLLWIVERLCSQESHWLRSNLAIMSAISEAYRRFQRMLHLSEKGDANQNLKKRLLKIFGDELPFFQRSPVSSELVDGTKDFKIKLYERKDLWSKTRLESWGHPLKN